MLNSSNKTKTENPKNHNHKKNETQNHKSKNGKTESPKLKRENSNSSISTTDSTNIDLTLPEETKKEKELGGIDLNYNFTELIKKSKDIKFQGIVKNSNSLLMFKQKKDFKNSKRNVFINLEDVAVILKILYDKTITNKNISFSLDPLDPKNPSGPYLKKVFYPDVLEKKKILEGTKLGEDMFIADFLLKQITMGYKSDNKTKFEIPKELSNKGLKSIEFKKNIENKSLNRVWVVIKKIKNIVKKNNLFCVDNIELGVESREMEITNNGLKDKVNQNKNDQFVTFAKKFSELYENISQIYKCFYRLKEIAGALSIAKWIFENKFPIDFNLVNKIYESTLIPNYETKIKSISHSEIEEKIEKIPVKAEDVAIKALKNSGIEVNKKNIELAEKQIKEKNIDLNIKRTLSFKSSLVGGVDLWSSLFKNENEENLLNNSFSSNSTVDDESNINLFNVVNNNNIKVNLSKCDVKKFPLLQEEKCKICNKELTMEEMITNNLYSKMYEGNYCHFHNPFKCLVCNKLIKENLLSINGKNYHRNCIKCFHCGKCFNDNKFLNSDKGFIHIECAENLKKKLIHDNEKKILEKCPNCELCGKKITSNYFKINNYLLHSECKDKVEKLDINENKEYILGDLIKKIPKCSECQKYLKGNFVKVEGKGMFHKECFEKKFGNQNVIMKKK